MRVGERQRRTAETSLAVRVDLDGGGLVSAQTPLGFLDHMVTALAHHAGWDLTLTATGDLGPGYHHLLEDTGLALGEAVAAALGDRRGIRRYGWAAVPMDEALALVAADLGGRAACQVAWGTQDPLADWPEGPGGVRPAVLAEWWRGLAAGGRLALHVQVLAGGGPHHVLEACHKAMGLALGQATAQAAATPTTKGVVRP